MIKERIGVIVWVHDIKPIQQLEKFGIIHYVSKRLKYAVVYMNKENSEQAIQNMKRYGFVKQVEFSHRKDIRTEYDKSIPDKTRTYSY